MSDIKERVRSTLYSAIASSLQRPVEDLTDTTELIADLGAKSVNIVRIIGALEDEFDLEIPFMEFRRKKTIGEAVDYIAALYES